MLRRGLGLVLLFAASILFSSAEHFPKNRFGTQILPEKESAVLRYSAYPSWGSAEYDSFDSPVSPQIEGRDMWGFDSAAYFFCWVTVFHVDLYSSDVQYDCSSYIPANR